MNKCIWIHTHTLYNIIYIYICYMLYKCTPLGKLTVGPWKSPSFGEFGLSGLGPTEGHHECHGRSTGDVGSTQIPRKFMWFHGDMGRYCALMRCLSEWSLRFPWRFCLVISWCFNGWDGVTHGNKNPHGEEDPHIIRSFSHCTARFYYQRLVLCCYFRKFGESSNSIFTIYTIVQVIHDYR